MELSTVPATHTDVREYSNDEVLSSCSRDAIAEKECRSTVDVSEELLLDEVTEDEELFTSSSAINDWRKLMKIDDKLISLGEK